MGLRCLQKTLVKCLVPVVFCVFLLCAAGIALAQWFSEKLPALPPPSQYGNILINRVSEQSDMLPVGFSHWQHRRKYTCRVCHTELGFEMQTNSTEIIMEDINRGLYCGACHDGKRAFGKTECKKCHNGNIKAGSGKFRKFAESMPMTEYGNRVDWSLALRKRLIKPKDSLNETHSPESFDKFLTLEAEWSGIPPAIFPHDSHIRWLECSSCHPDIFNIKKKKTKHLLMSHMLDGKFCGVCHLKIAFPLDDCKRCHPAMTSR